MNFVALGRTEHLYDTILALTKAGHEATAIATAPAAPEYLRRDNDFKALAETLGCPFFGREIIEGVDHPALRQARIAVSVNWPSLIPLAFLRQFPLGVLNIHAGDLPRYRGNACPNWAILQGEDEVVLSVHRMQPNELDCGPIFAQGRMPLTESTYISDVNAWILKIAPQLFLDALNSLQVDPEFAIRRVRADDPESMRCFPRLPEDGYIDWTQSADSIQRLVRASAPPLPGAYTYMWDKNRLQRVHILKAKVARRGMGHDLAVPGQILINNAGNGESRVACGEGTILILEECRIRQTPTFKPGAAWKSIRSRLGVRVEDICWAMLRDRDLAE